MIAVLDVMFAKQSVRVFQAPLRRVLELRRDRFSRVEVRYQKQSVPILLLSRYGLLGTRPVCVLIECVTTMLEFAFN